MRFRYLLFASLALIAGCASSPDGAGTASTQGTPGIHDDPTYPGTGVHIGIGAGRWGGRSGGGVGIGLGW